MELRFLRTKLATDWPEGKGLKDKLIDAVFFFIPKGNPGYEDKMHLINEWFVEFGDDGTPGREIGIGKDGQVVIAGPSDRDYGFWLDTNMKYDDFEGEEIPEEIFEKYWVKSEPFRNDKNA